VLGRRLVPELLQDALQPAAIVSAVESLLDPASEERRRMEEGYHQLRNALGEPGVTDRAAAAILDLLVPTPPCA